MQYDEVAECGEVASSSESWNAECREVATWSFGSDTEDLDALIFILTGMSGPDFRMAYQLRLVDDLLRYTDLPLAEVARRSGFGSHTNFCVVIRRERKQTPTERRMALRQKGDAGRYRV